MSANYLQFYHTGAHAEGWSQPDPTLSLGGYRSATPIKSLEAMRPAALAGIEIREVSGINGPGVGTLEAATADTVVWTAPGDTESGPEATLVYGEDVAVYPYSAVSALGDKYLIVRRTTEDDLSGREPVQLLDIYNNAIGTSDFTAAEATVGESHYRGFIFKNLSSAAAMSDVTFWIDPDQTGLCEIALEALSSNQIQTIADENTAPTGLTWVSPTTEGTGLTLATLTQDGKYGLWVRTYVSASTPASARDNIIIHYKFTADILEEWTWYGHLRGLRSTLGAPLYELFLETSTPDPDTDTPVASGATAPLTDVAALAEGTYYAALYYTNEYGLRDVVRNAAGEETTRIDIDSGGDSVTLPPSAPQDVQIVPAADGTATLSAVYAPNVEGADAATIAARRADTWLYGYTVDGTAVTASIEVPMNRSGLLESLPPITIPATLDGTPIAALVKTRRQGTPDSDSENTTEVTTTSVASGPSRPRAALAFGNHYAQHFAPATITSGDIDIDAANNVFFSVTPGSVSLYADTQLIWRAIYDGEDPDSARLYFPSDVFFEAASVLNIVSGTITDYDYGISSESGDPLYIYLVSEDDGTRSNFVKIDVAGKVLTVVQNLDAPIDLDWRGFTDPGHERYKSTYFQIFDPATERHIPYLEVNETGMNSQFFIDQSLTQAQIEAL